jgi:hypothetical protein
MARIKGSDWGGSRLSAAQTCKQYYYNRYNRPHPTDSSEGIIKIEDGYAATKGSLLHKALQVYYELQIKEPEGNRRDHGLIAIHHMLEHIKEFNIPPNKIPLLTDEVMSAMDQYLSFYCTDTLVPLAVEKPVSVKVPDVDGTVHVHTGIVDLFALWHDAPFIVDHKTTSRGFDVLFQSYAHSLSFKGYCKAAAAEREQQVGVLVNAIRFKGNKALECEFQREAIMYTEQALDEFEPTVLSIKREIRACEVDGFWPKADKQCIQPWGACEYFPLCKYDDPVMVQALYKGAKTNET